MKQNITTALLLFLSCISISLYAQNNFFNYEKITIKEAQIIEKPYHSKEVVLNYKIGYRDFEQPIVFNRPKDFSFEPVRVEYFYLKTDSIVRSASYRWNVKANTDRKAFFKVNNVVFDKIVEVISKEIGQPQPNQGKVKKLFDATMPGKPQKIYVRRIVWENNNCKVTMTLLWSEKHGEDFHTTIDLK